MPNANPISGPYNAPASKYHSNPASYNRSVLATAPFLATGSYANPSGFYASGSAAAVVTLVNGGSLAVPAIAASAPAAVYEVSVYSVDSGTVILLYR